MKRTNTILAGLIAASPLAAIDMEQVEIYGYGVINYQQYDYLQNYQSAPENRAKIDMERFVLSPRFILDETTKIVSEIEFEHGGTGATMEYDTLEEFGEFETEVEKGGEIVIEELYVDIAGSSYLNYRLGHMMIPVGLNTQRHLPSLYLSPLRNRSETRLLPDAWHETGAMLYGSFGGDWHYQAMVMSGLNSEFFDSSGWIKFGMQKRFEHVNADDLAFALRLDYGTVTGSHIGASLYTGATSKNRNKSRLEADGRVTIVDLHGVYEARNVKLHALALLGTLSDSEAISRANANLPNALEAKRTPVGSEALACFAELGYNVSELLGMERELVPYVRYDFSDTMHGTEGSVQELSRYEQQTFAAGVDYSYSANVIVKAEYAATSFGDASLEEMDALTLGVGFQF